MKKLFLVAVLLIAQGAQADILNSVHESRHTYLIEQAILKTCGAMKDLSEISSESTKIKVDNGIVDIASITTLRGFKRLDQQFFDPYQMKVHSLFNDVYDHSSGEWGIYTINSVSCEQI